MKRLSVVLAVFGILLASQVVCSAKDKSLFKIGGDAIVEDGTTVKSVAAIKGNVFVNGTVEEDAVAILGSITLGPKAVIKKNVVSIKGDIYKDPRAQIMGSITEIGKGCFKSPSFCGFGKFFFGMKLLVFLGFLALALLFTAIFPKYIQNVTQIIEKNMFKSFAWGLIGTLLIAPVGFLLLISIIGIFLIPIEIILVILAMLMGYFIFARYAGKKIALAFKFRETSMLFEVFIGLIVLALVGFIPFIGHIIKMLAVTIGFGGVLIILQNKLKK